jgi:multiple antibiotic resistance protein
MIETLLPAYGKAMLITVATLLPILNPAATAPLFLTLTEGASDNIRAGLARRVARNVFLMLLGAMLIGSFVLDFFGISLPIVRVGGGLLVVASAWRLLNAQDAEGEDRGKMAGAFFTREQARRQAFYPLTFPLTCGPGSISAAITVGVSLHDARISKAAVSFAGALSGLLIVSLLTLLALRFAAQLLRPLGETGTMVFLRLSAFILLCLGVQIFWSGASELLASVLRP